MTFLNATINLKGGSMSKTTPVYARITKEEFDYEIQKGISSLNQGFFYTAEEVDNLFKNYDRIYLGILI